MEKEEAIEIKKYVDRILKKLSKHPKLRKKYNLNHDIVEWKNLRVVDFGNKETYLPNENDLCDLNIYIDIGSASPSAELLYQYLCDKIAEKFGVDVLENINIDLNFY